MISVEGEVIRYGTEWGLATGYWCPVLMLVSNVDGNFAITQHHYYYYHHHLLLTHSLPLVITASVDVEVSRLLTYHRVESATLMELYRYR